jgi:hypothetical protein
MAKGYPDFFGYSIFPQFGVPQRSTGNVVIPTASGSVITTLTGKGVTVGGYLMVSNSDDLPNITIRYTLDSQGVVAVDLQTLLYGSKGGGMGDFPLEMRYFDEEEGRANLAVRGGFTFQSDLELWSYNFSAANAITWGRDIYWAIVL